MPSSSLPQETDRALGAFLGGALGDALGMPTQTMTAAEIRESYGEITDFVAPVPTHPVSAGLPAAAVTDDTEQSLLLAERIVADPERFDEAAWAESLMAWEEDVRARGLLDLLGPSTKKALEALLSGASPEESGRMGTTNGASMRIAPVGAATPPEPLSALLDRVEEASRATHNTREAIAGASAVAAAISAGVDGADAERAFAFAVEAAEEGESRGHRHGASGMAERIRQALSVAAESGEAPGSPPSALAGRIAREIGVSVASIESVPAAFGLARLGGGDAWRAALMAANLGGDADTIGAMAAGMAGACRGASSLPPDKLARLREANGLELDGLVSGLLEIRAKRRAEFSARESAA